MLAWFRQLDDILRGEATQQPSIERGQLELPVGGLSVLIVLLGAISGLCTGSFALFRALWTDIGTTDDAAMQLIASAVKLPLLFLLTLLVTFPSLYVFSALAGSRLSMASAWRLLLAMLGVMLAVSASFGPIIVFFGASSESYAFIKLLNVAAASVAGGLGLTFLLRTLHRLVSVHDREFREAKLRSLETTPTEISQEKPAGDDNGASDAGDHSSDSSASDEEIPVRPLGALDRTGPTSARARLVFEIWVIVFAVVGAQMSWVLRPFIGSPGAAFSWFREREGNFFLDVVRAIGQLLGA